MRSNARLRRRGGVVRGRAAGRSRIAGADQPHLSDGGAARADFERARLLAERELKLDPSDAVAQLVLLIDRRQGRRQGRRARSTPRRCRRKACIVSSARSRCAWTRMAVGDLAGADTALQRARQIQRLRPARISFSSGCFTTLPGKPDKAEENFKKDARGERPAQLAADRRDRQFLRAPRPRRQARGALSAVHQGEFRQRAGGIGAGAQAGRAAPAA